MFVSGSTTSTDGIIWARRWRILSPRRQPYGFRKTAMKDFSESPDRAGHVLRRRLRGHPPEWVPKGRRGIDGGSGGHRGSCPRSWSSGPAAAAAGPGASATRPEQARNSSTWRPRTRPRWSWRSGLSADGLRRRQRLRCSACRSAWMPAWSVCVARRGLLGLRLGLCRVRRARRMDPPVSALATPGGRGTAAPTPTATTTLPM